MIDIGVDRVSLILLFAFLSLAPFVLMMISSFIKLVCVLSIVRNALGVQQIPPNTIINGLAIMISAYVMAPVMTETYSILKTQEFSIKQPDADKFMSAYEVGKVPTQQFLMKHSGKAERMFFIKTAKVLWPAKDAEALKEDSFFVLIPAFTISELTSSFKIGFLIYLPFIMIDLIVSNILLAMGMMMVSPLTISLPFKLLLFVLVDGWSRLIHGVVLTYK